MQEHQNSKGAANYCIGALSWNMVEAHSRRDVEVLELAQEAGTPDELE
jgi:hypothetical protein